MSGHTWFRCSSAEIECQGAIQALETDHSDRGTGCATTHAAKPGRRLPSRLLCRYCGASVTDEAARTNVDDAHVHVRINPHAQVFEFGCFAYAPGCAALGPDTMDWTWFAGHGWSVAVCRICGAQLGWRFRAGTVSEFYAIIVGRLLPEQPSLH